MFNRTPFYEVHQQADAKLIDFGGWEMPVQYESIKQEHNAVRNDVGLFDVSHMGEFFVEGAEVRDLIQHVTVNDVARLEPGKAQYTVMCYEDGGIVDDLIVYMLDEQQFMLVVNAANIEKDFDWITRHNSFDAGLNNCSKDMGLLAVQGPKSLETLQKLTDLTLSEISFYHFKKGNVGEFEDVIFSSTGYTGEQGFELYFDKHEADPAQIWQAIMKAGREFNIQPCGLGARNTLRLEMGFPLYGNDITKDTNPLEAGLGWLTKLEKGEFVGREALANIKEQGISRRLRGFVIDDRRSIPRSGYTILNDKEEEIGVVTSGSRSITLGKNIGMGYISKESSQEGTQVLIKIRNSLAKAKVVKPPFLKKN